MMSALPDTVSAGVVPRTLKLAVVTETYPPEINGVAMTVSRWLTELVERGHELQLVRPRQPHDVPDHDSDYRQLTVPGLPIPLYSGLRLGLPVDVRLLRSWRQWRPDLVHIVTEGPLGASALRVARRLGIPVSSGFHTNFHQYSHHYRLGWCRGAVIRYLRRFHNRCDLTLVPTAQLAGQLAEQGFANLQVIARGVDTRLFDPARRDPELRSAWGVVGPGPAVLYVGRLAAEKNIELAIKAFGTIRARCPGARLILVGDGPMRDSLAERYPEFRFCGVQHGTRLAAHYASADLFLFPSTTETFGNVVLEAMASALAVVAFDDAAARQFIVTGRNGVTVPLDDSSGFCDQAARLAADPLRTRHYGHLARRTIETVSWSTIGRQLESVFYQAIDPQGERL